ARDRAAARPRRPHTQRVGRQGLGKTSLSTSRCHFPPARPEIAPPPARAVPTPGGSAGKGSEKRHYPPALATLVTRHPEPPPARGRRGGFTPDCMSFPKEATHPRCYCSPGAELRGRRASRGAL